MYQKFIVNSTWCLKLAMNKFHFFCYKTIISVMLTLIPQILIPIPYKKGLVRGCFHENLVKFFKIGNFQNASAVLLKLIRLPETKIPNNSFCNDIMRKNCFHFVTVFYGSWEFAEKNKKGTTKECKSCKNKCQKDIMNYTWSHKSTLSKFY